MRKEKVQELVEALPDEVDLDGLMERLYLLRKIEIAEEQLARGEGIAHEEVKRQLGKWLE